MHFVRAKGLLSQGNGINIYRGCTHGCIYCDSRSTCYHIDHNFEDIEVKQNAPELLRDALSRRRKRCMIATGAMCDPYMHCEESLGLTRQCLDIIEEFGFGVAVQTKSDRILRDFDRLCRIHQKSKAVVQMTLTTFDKQLCRILEPDVCGTERRAEVLRKFSDAGIPTVAWITPILPFLNDTEENLRGVLELCFHAGVCGIVWFGAGVTLREGDREYCYAAFDRHFPGLKAVYQKKFGNAYECMSDNNARLSRIFHEECERRGVMHDNGQIFDFMHRFPEEPVMEQIGLFDGLT
ncbi:MAG: radical SAM protein [Clostridia bacterium]|nr:radical SAM protein [Clostridia bacterium]